MTAQKSKATPAEAAPEAPAEVPAKKAYSPTASALADLSLATAGGTLTNHPLVKTGVVGVYTAMDGRFQISHARPVMAGMRWLVRDTTDGREFLVAGHPETRLAVNLLAAGQDVPFAQVPATT